MELRGLPRNSATGDPAAFSNVRFNECARDGDHDALDRDHSTALSSMTVTDDYVCDQMKRRVNLRIVR
jgi:hypothetical protein